MFCRKCANCFSMKYISILATFTVDLKIDQAKLGLTNLILEVIDYVDESFLFNSIQLLLNLSHNPNVGKHFLKPEERKKLIYKIGVLMYLLLVSHHPSLTHHTYSHISNCRFCCSGFCTKRFHVIKTKYGIKVFNIVS